MPRFNISVEPEGKGFHETVQRLRKAGVKVEQELEFSGVVTGTVDASAESKLRRIPGVRDIVADSEVQLPPPESPVQ